MRTSPCFQVSIATVVAIVPLLLSCGGSNGDGAGSGPAPQDVGSLGLFAQDRVLRNERTVLASMPSRPGVSYSWSVVDGSASATIVEGAGSNVVRVATGEGVGTFTLKAAATAADGSVSVASRTLQVVSDWLLDSANPLPRQNHSATLLSDGRVLVAGGIMGFGSGAPNPSAQIYDPETNTWGPAPPIPTPRSAYTATRLASGDVLVAGGRVGSGTVAATAAVEIYDVASRLWRRAAGMRTARYGHTATLLLDGRVLVTAGTNAASVGGGPLASAEIYDPVADSWSEAGSLMSAREGHTAVQLSDGRVLVCAGIDRRNNLDLVLSSAELYDPVKNSWSRTGDLAIGRSGHAAARLADGRVIVAGGAAQGWAMPVQAEAYDPSTGAWSGAGSLNAPRWLHTLSLLPDGRPLVIGGNFVPSSYGQPSAEVYDPGANRWSRVQDMAEGRVFHTSTTLGNGMVLVVGGVDDLAPLASAERYSPSTDRWSSAGRSNALLASSHTATLLRDGTLLQAGGEAAQQPLRRTVRYDPTVNTWEDVGDLIAARFGHTATLLATGEVLVTGGAVSRLVTEPHLNTAEIFDPAARRWRGTAVMAASRSGHTATLLPNGRVLAVGGAQDGYSRLASAEWYDPSTGAWAAAAAMAVARHGHTATLLPTGQVLVAGGEASQPLSSVELYDAASDAWQQASAMASPRWGHSATLLRNGKVLVAGGYGTGQIPVAAAEVYDPATGSWSAAGSMSIGRVFHAATLLPDGRVMVTGGLDVDFSKPPLASTEIFDPATGAWAVQSSLSFARAGHTATVLADGKVAVLGGGGAFIAAATVEFWR